PILRFPTECAARASTEDSTRLNARKRHPAEERQHAYERKHGRRLVPMRRVDPFAVRDQERDDEDGKEQRTGDGVELLYLAKAREQADHGNRREQHEVDAVRLRASVDGIEATVS